MQGPEQKRKRKESVYLHTQKMLFLLIMYQCIKYSMGESIKVFKKTVKKTNKKTKLKAETSHFILIVRNIFCGHLTAVVTVER